MIAPRRPRDLTRLGASLLFLLVLEARVASPRTEAPAQGEGPTPRERASALGTEHLGLVAPIEVLSFHASRGGGGMGFLLGDAAGETLVTFIRVRTHRSMGVTSEPGVWLGATDPEDPTARRVEDLGAEAWELYGALARWSERNPPYDGHVEWISGTESVHHGELETRVAAFLRRLDARFRDQERPKPAADTGVTGDGTSTRTGVVFRRIHGEISPLLEKRGFQTYVLPRPASGPSTRQALYMGRTSQIRLLWNEETRSFLLEQRINASGKDWKTILEMGFDETRDPPEREDEIVESLRKTLQELLATTPGRP